MERSQLLDQVSNLNHPIVDVLLDVDPDGGEVLSLNLLIMQSGVFRIVIQAHYLFCSSRSVLGSNRTI